ncbi:hypothetical protein ZWY2020_030730 [Hordeum vulgare]|nr:hypothetical protein ZWY2020_030730 [Hordeum vulgare]
MASVAARSGLCSLAARARVPAPAPTGRRMSSSAHDDAGHGHKKCHYHQTGRRATDEARLLIPHPTTPPRPSQKRWPSTIRLGAEAMADGSSSSSWPEPLGGDGAGGAAGLGVPPTSSARLYYVDAAEALTAEAATRLRRAPAAPAPRSRWLSRSAVDETR